MKLLRVWALAGPNIWANFPVLEAGIDLGQLRECSTHSIPGFVERLTAWVPSLAEHRCTVGRPSGLHAQGDDHPGARRSGTGAAAWALGLSADTLASGLQSLPDDSSSLIF
jgi:hypothetical protein